VGTTPDTSPAGAAAYQFRSSNKNIIPRSYARMAGYGYVNDVETGLFDDKMAPSYEFAEKEVCFYWKLWYAAVVF
jgi:hypothetical protein